MYVSTAHTTSLTQEGNEADESKRRTTGHQDSSALKEKCVGTHQGSHCVTKVNVPVMSIAFNLMIFI